MVGDAARARLGGVVRVVSHEGVPRGFHLLAVPSPRGEEFDEDRLPLDGGIVAAGGDTVRRTVSRFHERARARAFILAGKGGTHLSSVSSVAEAEARARARIIFIIVVLTDILSAKRRKLRPWLPRVWSKKPGSRILPGKKIDTLKDRESRWRLDGAANLSDLLSGHLGPRNGSTRL